MRRTPSCELRPLAVCSLCQAMVVCDTTTTFFGWNHMNEQLRCVISLIPGIVQTNSYAVHLQIPDEGGLQSSMSGVVKKKYCFLPYFGGLQTRKRTVNNGLRMCPMGVLTHIHCLLFAVAVTLLMIRSIIRRTPVLNYMCKQSKLDLGNITVLRHGCVAGTWRVRGGYVVGTWRVRGGYVRRVRTSGTCWVNVFPFTDYVH